MRHGTAAAGLGGVGFSAATAAAAGLGAPRWVWIACAVFAGLCFVAVVVLGCLWLVRWWRDRKEGKPVSMTAVRAHLLGSMAQHSSPSRFLQMLNQQLEPPKPQPPNHLPAIGSPAWKRGQLRQAAH